MFLWVKETAGLSLLAGLYLALSSLFFNQGSACLSRGLVLFLAYGSIGCRFYGGLILKWSNLTTLNGQVAELVDAGMRAVSAPEERCLLRMWHTGSNPVLTTSRMV